MIRRMSSGTLNELKEGNQKNVLSFIFNDEDGAKPIRTRVTMTNPDA